MTFSHTTGQYNVLGTLYAWLQGALTGNKPPLLSSVTLVVENPQDPMGNATLPCYSVHYLGADTGPSPYQGGRVDDGSGEQKFGIVEVNAWATRRDANWRAQLVQMQDALTKAVVSLRSTGSALIIKDFYTNAAAPSNVSYRIVIDRVEARTPPYDQNPDIERRRMLLYFSWIERA